MAANEKQWSSATPGLLIILVDKSGSMMLPYQGADGSESRTVFVTKAINRTIREIINKNSSGKEPKNRCFISVISYCSEVKEECSGFLQDLFKSPKGTEIIKKRIGDIEKEKEYPIWIEPTNKDTWTDMRGAFLMAKKIVENWVNDKPNNPAPVIINISDGVPYYDHKPNEECMEETKNIAKEIMNISNADGNVLIFNAEIGDSTEKIITPNSVSQVKVGGEGAEFLYEISSVIPSGYLKAAEKNGLPIENGSRGCIFSADADYLIKLIDFGSSKGRMDQ